MERDRSDSRNSLQDSGTGVLDELLSYFELEANILDTQTLSHSFTMPQPSNFTSAIKFFGQPILPPVMTDERYEEMAMYKRQAIFTETRLKARSRQKLLSRVQNIVDSMHTRKSVPSRQNTVKSPITSSIDRGTQLSLDADTDAVTSEQSLYFLAPDSLELEENVPNATESRVAPVVPATKVSPRSEAKDSGISSQSPAGIDQSEVSVVTVDPSIEEPQDTMAEITDISDEDQSEDQPCVQPSVPVGARPQTVAERLGSAFRPHKEDNEQSGELLPGPQSSARSSASCTTSTASTDDTTLQHTVLAQPAGSTTQESSKEFNHEEPLSTTDESIKIVDVETGFEPLSSTRSLLSRVAFNVEDDEPVEDVKARRIGDLSEIVCSSQSKETFADSTTEDGITDKVGGSTNLDPAQISSITEPSSQTTGPVVTPDLSNIESGPDTSDVRAESPKVREEPEDLTNQSQHKDSLPETTEEPQKDPVPPPVNTGATQNASDSSIDIWESAQNVTEGSKSVADSSMYTMSTDIDKYMAGSLDTDTIQSSITTLPHTLEESDTDRETPLVETSVLNPGPPVPNLALAEHSSPESTSPDQPETARRQPSPSEKSVTSVSQSTDTSVPTNEHGQQVRASKDPPKPFTSHSSPEKSAPSPRERVLRRGSYTLESPTTKAVALRRGSYTLDSPSAALLNAVSNLDQERPKRHLGHTQPVAVKTPPDEMNQSQARSEPPPVFSRFELTSSMEDLKLKPVQRTLTFDEDSSSNQTQSLSGKNGEHQQQEQQPENNINNNGGEQQVPQQLVTVGKEEHLRRYLQTLSQMPQVPPTHETTPTTSTQSSPQGVSQTSDSPGQVPVVDPGHGSLKSGEIGSLTDESLSQSLQMEFESLQVQLLEQQQQQLSGLLAEQQRQQMLMQQEFIKYESMLLQSSGADHEVLLQQLQGRQQELVQQQMAMQQQLRWQMHQQQLQLQEQFTQLKQSQDLQRLVRPQLSAGPAMARDKKTMRRQTWKEREQEGPFVIEAQADDASTTSENPPGASLLSGGVGVPASRLRPHGRYFRALLNTDDKAETSTDTTISSTYPRTSSHTVNRSGVSVTSDPFSTQRSESAQSAQTDSLSHKKRVSFSTDIDATSETGSVISQSTTSHSLNRSDPVPPGYYRVGGHLYPTPSIEPVPEAAESRETSVLSSAPSSPGRLVSGVHVQSPVSASLSSRISKTSRSSPKSPRRVALSGPKLTIQDTVIPPELQTKFEKVSAAARGYLTRRLMKSDKVQQIIKTITDTAEFAVNFQLESRMSASEYTQQDRELVDRVVAQLTSALYDIHEIFFELSVEERMALIAQTRAMEKELIFKQKEAKKQLKEKRLSAATLKARERKKKARAAEQAVFGDLRPKSTTPATSSPRGEKRPDLSGPLRRNYQYMMSRVLKPIQAHLSPIKPVKDTLNSNPLRGSYDKLYMRALKRAVAMEKKEQRDKKQKTGMINLKNVRPKVVTGFTYGPKKQSAGNRVATANQASENQPEANQQYGNHTTYNNTTTNHTTTNSTMTNHTSTNHTTNNPAGTNATRNNTTTIKRLAPVPRPKSALQTHPWK